MHGVYPILKKGDDLRYFLFDVVSYFVCNEIRRAEYLLDERHALPLYWADDLLAYMRAAEDALLDPGVIEPVDLNCAKAEKVALFQKLIAQFGEVLIYWPEIVHTAKELRIEGIRPLSPVEERVAVVSTVKQ